MVHIGTWRGLSISCAPTALLPGMFWRASTSLRHTRQLHHGRRRKFDHDLLRASRLHAVLHGLPLIMRRLSTVESLLGAAADIEVACASSGSVLRHYQQDNLVAVEPENFDGIDRLTSVPVEPCRSPAGGEFRACFRPFVEVVRHAVNAPEPNRQHRQQIWQLRGEVVTARPPGPIDILTLGRLGLQSQSRRVFRRCVVPPDLGWVLL